MPIISTQFSTLFILLNRPRYRRFVIVGMTVLFFKGMTVATMKNILIEMMSLFPDKYFHLGLDEVKNSSLCTFESKKKHIFCM